MIYSLMSDFSKTIWFGNETDSCAKSILNHRLHIPSVNRFSHSHNRVISHWLRSMMCYPLLMEMCGLQVPLVLYSIFLAIQDRIISNCIRRNTFMMLVLPIIMSPVYAKMKADYFWIGTVGGITIYDPWKNRFTPENLMFLAVTQLIIP